MTQNIKISIIKAPNYLQNKYCMLQFKGKFEAQGQTNQQQQNINRQMMHLGDLQQIQPNTYRFEIGVMDLIGKGSPLKSKMYYMQKQKIGNDIKLVIKGIVQKKIMFDKRPVPDMQRAKLQSKVNVNTSLFKNSNGVKIQQND